MNSQIPIHHLRTLQPVELQNLHQSADGTLHLQTLSPGLQSLDAMGAEAGDALFQQRYHLGEPPPAPHGLHAAHPYDPNAGLPHSQSQFQPIPAGYQHVANRFDLISAPRQHLHAPPPPPPVPRAPQQIVELEPQTEYGHNQDADDTPVTSHGQFEGLKLIAHPPNLSEWRDKLFHVDDTVTLTENEFQTYFPHIDNVYSHRSTQRHKRKRFVSHYWDCRLKGRPSGTKKSTDPDKKKRKRVARERDLCDVKIKITEYFDGAELTEQTGQQPPMDTMDGNPFFAQPQVAAQQQANPWGMQNMGASMPMNQAVVAPKKFYTIQRVNGNGGNGKGDGVAGPHKHTLEESDKVKKNSVIRWMLKSERDKKRVQVRLLFICSYFIESTQPLSPVLHARKFPMGTRLKMHVLLFV